MMSLRNCSGKNNGFYGKKHTEATRAKLRAAHARRKALGITRFCSEETKRKISAASKGRPSWNQGLRTVGYKDCEICKKEFYIKSHGDLDRRRFCSYKCLADFNSTRMTGSGSPFWRGGISPVNKALRASREFREWRKAVFARDNYTCQDCGARSSAGKHVELHPHHIKAFAHYPELRFEVSNGLTLCADCHKLTDNYSRKALSWSSN